MRDTRKLKASQTIINRTDERNARGNPAQEKPYCWQAKHALKLIRDHLHAAAPSGIAVYVALTEIASDKRSSEFQATIAEIMAKAGILSDRTVRVRLRDLAEIGVIAVRENRINERLRAPSTYVIRSVVNTDRPVTSGTYALPGEEKNGRNLREDPLAGLTRSERYKAAEIRCRVANRQEVQQ